MFSNCLISFALDIRGTMTDSSHLQLFFAVPTTLFVDESQLFAAIEVVSWMFQLLWHVWKNNMLHIPIFTSDQQQLVLLHISSHSPCISPYIFTGCSKDVSHAVSHTFWWYTVWQMSAQRLNVLHPTKLAIYDSLQTLQLSEGAS